MHARDASHSFPSKASFDGSATWAAGVLIVADGPCGERLLLLGKDYSRKNGGWSDFAGGREPEDSDPVDTALRELCEETSGVVKMTREDLEKSLVETFRDVTPSGRIITRYLVAAKFDERLPSRFDPPSCRGGEKTALAWFDVRRLPRLRRVFDVQMRRDGREIENAPIDVPLFSASRRGEIA